MSWRLPPPVWIASRRKTAMLAGVLQAGAMAWRLAKWCVAAGLVLAVLPRFTSRAGSGWTATAWLGAGAWLLFLWERYGVAEAPLASGRWPRWALAAALAMTAGAGTWAVAHFAGPLAATALGASA